MKSSEILSSVSWCVVLLAACSPSIVEPIGGGPATDCVASGAGCGGSARDIEQGGRSGSAGASTGGQNGGSLGEPGVAGAGAGPIVPVQGGSGGEATCMGALDTVAASWGSCPSTLCAGLVWAESCPVSSQVATTSVATCGGLRAITLDWGTHGKACYYQPTGLNGGEPKLVGAAAWDDTPSYCNGTSFRIESGNTDADCAHQTASEIVCDGSVGVPDASAGAGGQGETGSDDTPPKAGPPACYDALSRSCQPCCPTPPPDCTGKPNGYPGYRCTVSPNSFCSCDCVSEEWSCGC